MWAHEKKQHVLRSGGQIDQFRLESDQLPGAQVPGPKIDPPWPQDQLPGDPHLALRIEVEPAPRESAPQRVCSIRRTFSTLFDKVIKKFDYRKHFVKI